MNKVDFQRNFSSSYYGLIYNDHIRSTLSPQLGSTLLTYDLYNGILIPASRPQVDGNKQAVNLLFKKKGSDEMESHRLNIPWKENVDEDKTFMRPGVPSIGMIQGSNTAVYVSRIPVRDTPRGHAPRFCRTVAVNKAALQGLNNGGDTLTVWRIFNKVYFNWETAIEHICNGVYIGVAVDRFIALGVLPNKRFIQIFYKDLGSVGHVDGSKPYVFGDKATPSIIEYIKKLSGQEPEEL